MMSQMSRTFMQGVSCLAAMASIGCGSSPSALGEAPTISGQIGNWTGGMGTILAQIETSTVDMSPETHQTIAMATIDATGSFSITLPGHDQMVPFLKPLAQINGPRCPSQYFQVSAPDAMGAWMYGFVVNASVLFQGKIFVPSKHAIFVHYEYVDRDLSIQGSVNSQTCNIEFKAGWNYYLEEADNTTSPGFFSEKTGPLPPGTIWQIGP